MTTSTSERRRFGMHANLLFDVITKQAGTLQKAILEGVMNGVDAGATEICITLSEKHLTIVDNGKGFANRGEIEQFFETFGTPHKEGDATYGRFRMGRGQLFAFGANEWRTNNFKMNVDIKAKGLDYDLEVVSRANPGCSIEIDLYEPLLPSEKDSIERELRAWVAYVDIPVFLGDKCISQDPKGAKWDVETDDAYFKLASTKSTLSVYNLGVLVMNAPASRYGTGGTVVSKQRLDVNFARNDVQNTCPVFNKIKAELRKHSDQIVKTKPRITDDERTHLAERVIDKSIDFKESLQIKVLTDVDGRHHALGTLTKWLHQTRDVIVVAKGDRLGIAIRDQKLAHALAEETLDRFSVGSIEELVEALYASGKAWLDERGPDHWRYSGWEVRHFIDAVKTIVPKTTDDYRHLIDSDYEAVPEKKLKKNELALLRVIQAGVYPIQRITEQAYRKIHIGRSDMADAWTDGTRNIWININKLKLLRDGYQGCAQIAAILLHEFMHEGPDTDTHTHDAEFYQRHHDLVCDTEVIGASVAAMMHYLAFEARQRDKKPAARIALFEDMEARIVREGGYASEKPNFELVGVDPPEFEEQSQQAA